GRPRGDDQRRAVPARPGAGGGRRRCGLHRDDRRPDRDRGGRPAAVRRQRAGDPRGRGRRHRRSDRGGPRPPRPRTPRSRGDRHSGRPGRLPPPHRRRVIRRACERCRYCRPETVELDGVTDFDEPLDKALDPKTAKLLSAALGLSTVGDLLRHYPRRYAERGELTAIDALEVDEHVTVVGEVARTMRKPMRNRSGTWLEVEVVDARGNRIYLSFFGKASHAVESRLKPGRRGTFAGKVTMFGRAGRPRWQLAHPDFELFGESDSEPEEFATAPVPIYPASKDVSSWVIRRAVGIILDTLGPIPDPLPAEVRARHGLPELADALTLIHRPADFGEVERARKRLKFDEAFQLQAVLAQRRMAASALPAKPRPRRDDGLLAEFDRRLPFELTEGQRAVGEEIAADLAASHPMHRLLQGEVGAGKTVVALRAMLQ